METLNGLLGYTNEFLFLYPLLMSFVWMLAGLIFYFKHEHGQTDPEPLAEYPPFSILVPCHNEEKHIRETIRQLSLLDYPDYEIIAIDDGSTDNTAKIMRELAAEYPRLRCLFLKHNQGKASALSMGSVASRHELLLTIDADALVDPQALKWMAWHFTKFPRVGAVTGNPRIVNRSTLLAKIQVGEFSTIIGLIKRSQRILGKVLTVSGVMAAFRKSALHSAGYWSTDMATEDIDITWKLERRFWDIRYEPRALCWIYVPETLRGLWRQRLRWSVGGMEVLKKNVSVWVDWRQRRLWPLYIESVASVVWAYCYWVSFALALIYLVTGANFGLNLRFPFPPLWAGSILALVCVLQFCVSFVIDGRYEKHLLKYLFWVIWYPFVYWMINSSTVVFAVPKVLFFKKKKNAVWAASDRGMKQQEEVVDIQNVAVETVDVPEQNPQHGDIDLIDDPTLKSKTLKTCEWSFALLLWMVWIYLLFPVVNLLAWFFFGKYIYQNVFLDEQYRHLVGNFTDGLVLLIIIYVMIASWSFYNHARFSKRERRLKCKELTPTVVAHYFSVPEKVVLAMRANKITVCQGTYYSSPISEQLGSSHLKAARRPIKTSA